MPINFDLFQVIVGQHRSFAEAFPQINFTEYHWGFHFEWDSSSHYLTNYIFISAYPEEDLSEIRKLMKNPNKKIYVKKESNLSIPQFTKNNEIGIYYRKSKKISSPLLIDTGIKYFSYKSSDRDFNLQENIKEMAEMENLPSEEFSEFNRLVGGYLHLFNGEFWILDQDGAVLCNALVSTPDEQNGLKIIEMLTTRPNLQNTSHQRDLVQSIIAGNKNTDFIVISKITGNNSALLQEFNFELHSIIEVLQ